MPPDLIKIVSGRAQGGFRAIGLAGDPRSRARSTCKGASLKVLGWLADAVGPFDASLIADRPVALFAYSCGEDRKSHGRRPVPGDLRPVDAHGPNRFRGHGRGLGGEHGRFNPGNQG